MIRVLIVDGQDEVRRGLRMRLGIEPDVTVVGETGKAGEALYLAEALNPDVIVVDIGMHGAEGLTLVKHLRIAAPAAAVVVLTLHGDEDTRARVREAGAQAFLEKCGGVADLLQAIRQLAAYRLRETSTGCLQRDSWEWAEPGTKTGAARPKYSIQQRLLWPDYER
jgi:DNA-binding NarL/FixJ family response regulator